MLKTFDVTAAVLPVGRAQLGRCRASGRERGGVGHWRKHAGVGSLRPRRRQCYGRRWGGGRFSGAGSAWWRLIDLLISRPWPLDVIAHT
jgi:hypothetical protein